MSSIMATGSTADGQKVELQQGVVVRSSGGSSCTQIVMNKNAYECTKDAQEKHIVTDLKPRTVKACLQEFTQYAQDVIFNAELEEIQIEAVKSDSKLIISVP